MLGDQIPSLEMTTIEKLFGRTRLQDLDYILDANMSGLRIPIHLVNKIRAIKFYWLNNNHKVPKNMDLIDQYTRENPFPSDSFSSNNYKREHKENKYAPPKPKERMLKEISPCSCEIKIG